MQGKVPKKGCWDVCVDVKMFLEFWKRVWCGICAGDWVWDVHIWNVKEFRSLRRGWKSWRKNGTGFGKEGRQCPFLLLCQFTTLLPKVTYMSKGKFDTRRGDTPEPLCQDMCRRPMYSSLLLLPKPARRLRAYRSMNEILVRHAQHVTLLPAHLPSSSLLQGVPDCSHAPADPVI